MMKKMIVLALAAASLLTAQAASVSYSLLAGTATNTAVIGSAALTRLTWANGGTAGAITLIDAATTAQTVTIGNYTNYTTTTTNSVATVTTNAQGVLQTNSYNIAYTSVTIKTNGTVALPRLVSLTAAANETVVFEPTFPVFFTRGILVTNSQAGDITIDYMTVR